MRRFGAWRARLLRKSADGWENHPYQMMLGVIVVQVAIQALKHYAKKIEEQAQASDQDVTDMIQQMKAQFDTVASSEN